MANSFMIVSTLVVIFISPIVIAVGSTVTDPSAEEPCASEPCENGADCARINAAFICYCLEGFTGLRCEINGSIACDSNLCNGGQCTTSDKDRYTCQCPLGLAGENCERDVDECTKGSHDCSPGLSCVNGHGNYTCRNFTCNDNPCLNGGSCSQHDGSVPECTCVEGYSGDFCEISTAVTETSATDPCSSRPCHNRGICSPSQTSPDEFICQCRSGFSGAVCDVHLHVVCLFDGIPFNEADTRYVDCNKCYCQKGSWFCTKKFCGKIHGSFKFTGSYEAISNTVQEFSRSLTEDLTQMFNIPKNMLTDLVRVKAAIYLDAPLVTLMNERHGGIAPSLQVSSGSIQVNFTLVSLKSQPDVKETATEIETALSRDNYTFTFQGEEFMVDPSSVHFEEEPNQIPSEAPNTLNPPGLNDTTILIIVIAAGVSILFVILLCVAKLCIKRHRAKNKAKQYQLEENGEVVQNVNNSNPVSTSLQHNHLYAVIDNSEAFHDVDEGVSVDMEGSDVHTYERPHGTDTLPETLPIEYKILEPYKTLEPYSDHEDAEDSCCQLEEDIMRQTEL